jgi:endonuclease/exonuclease/phosphatase (EEP) superfamily protein YafD
MGFKSSVFRAAVLLTTIVVSTALILGFFGRIHPALDSIAHFRAHLGVTLVACALGLAAANLRVNAIVALLLAAGAMTTTMPGLALPFGAAQAARSFPTSGQPTYRLLQYNLRWNHPEPDRVLKMIRHVQPDVLTFDEVSPMWAKALATLNGEYPFQVICDTRRYGSIILSRRPLVETGKERCFDRGSLAVAAVDFDGLPVEIGSIHLNWPWPYGQARQLDRLEGAIGDLDDTAILAGDFNAATWSAAVRRVAKVGKLTLIEGIGPTWIDYALPRSMRWAGLPIDNIMYKGAVRPVSARTIEDAGSDHWPVLLEFSVLSAPQKVAQSKPGSS